MYKIFKPCLIISYLSIFGKFNGQLSSNCPEINWRNGSNNAKKIMVSKFYYDPLDNWSPFGNDTGHDIYYFYCAWIKRHPKGEIKKFIGEELNSSGYPNFNLDMQDEDVEKLKEIVNAMLNKYIDLNAIDNKVIALAFSQLYLEGHVDSKVKGWAEAAFSRESVFLEFWDGEENEKGQRKERMEQMLNDLQKAEVK